MNERVLQFQTWISNFSFHCHWNILLTYCSISCYCHSILSWFHLAIPLVIFLVMILEWYAWFRCGEVQHGYHQRMTSKDIRPLVRVVRQWGRSGIALKPKSIWDMRSLTSSWMQSLVMPILIWSTKSLFYEITFDSFSVPDYQILQFPWDICRWRINCTVTSGPPNIERFRI